MKNPILIILTLIFVATSSYALFNPDEEQIVCDKIAELGGWTDQLNISKLDFCESYIRDQVKQKTIVKRDRYEFTLQSSTSTPSEVLSIEESGLNWSDIELVTDINWSDISKSTPSEYKLVTLDEKTYKGLKSGKLEAVVRPVQKKAVSLQFGEKRASSGGIILTADYEENYY